MVGRRRVIVHDGSRQDALELDHDADGAGVGAGRFRRRRSGASQKGAPARLDDVRLARLSEGTCVQTLHIGSYDDEAPVLDRMHHEFMPTHGLGFTGTHHEIYLSDARRVAPEKLRTILRQPVTTE